MVTQVMGLILLALMAFVGIGNASDISSRQVDTILNFYKFLATKKPTVKQFQALFGQHNEAELELILAQKFPSLNIEGNWFENDQASRYVDMVDKNPEKYPSRFFYCIRSVEPKLFSRNVKYKIDSQPNSSNSFREYSVVTDGEKVIFQFSQNEPYIENIILPNKRSIYDLINSCKKRQ